MSYQPSGSSTTQMEMIMKGYNMAVIYSGYGKLLFAIILKTDISVIICPADHDGELKQGDFVWIRAKKHLGDNENIRLRARYQMFDYYKLKNKLVPTAVTGNGLMQMEIEAETEEWVKTDGEDYLLLRSILFDTVVDLNHVLPQETPLGKSMRIVIKTIASPKKRGSTILVVVKVGSLDG